MSDPSAPDDEGPTQGEASRLMAEVRDRAEGGGSDGSGGSGAPAVTDIPATLAAARHHLDVAWHSSDAGTEIPDAVRMRQVKRAVMVGLRPVTSHQVPFNRELTIAVDRLATTIEALATQVGHTEGPLAATIRRVQAGIATVELGAAELDDEVADLVATLTEVTTRLAAAEEELAEQRQRLAAVERATAEAPSRDTGGGPARPEPPALDDPAEAGRARHEALVRRLARTARPSADDLQAWARAVADAVADATAEAPLLDLASDRGEWLAVWRELGIDATGVDDDPAALDLLAAAGLPSIAADPLDHLARLDAGSLGAVSAAVLADVVDLDVLLEVVDAAAVAVRPGGVLVLLLADPATSAAGDPQWADPRRRPLSAATVERLLLESGWSEVDVLPVGDDGADAPRAALVVARRPGGPSTT